MQRTNIKQRTHSGATNSENQHISSHIDKNNSNQLLFNSVIVFLERSFNSKTMYFLSEKGRDTKDLNVIIFQVSKDSHKKEQLRPNYCETSA